MNNSEFDGVGMYGPNSAHILEAYSEVAQVWGRYIVPWQLREGVGLFLGFLYSIVQQAVYGCLVPYHSNDWCQESFGASVLWYLRV